MIARNPVALPTTDGLVTACLRRCRAELDKNTRSALVIEFKDGAPFSCHIITRRDSLIPAGDGSSGAFDADFRRVWDHHSVGLTIPVVTLCPPPHNLLRLGVSGLPWADVPRVCGRCGSADHEERACAH